MAKIRPKGKLDAELAKTQAQFVLTELDLAITFCGLALTTKDPSAMARNVKNAVTGYRTAIQFSKIRDRDVKGDREFREKLGSLKNLLQRLGQETDDLEDGASSGLAHE
jgi:hypothetical protein